MGNTTKRKENISGVLPKTDLKRGMAALFRIQTEVFDELA
jgi:hypothetical protein